MGFSKHGYHLELNNSTDKYGIFQTNGYHLELVWDFPNTWIPSLTEKLNRQICIEKASLDSEAFASRSVIIDVEQFFFE